MYDEEFILENAPALLKAGEQNGSVDQVDAVIGISGRIRTLNRDLGRLRSASDEAAAVARSHGKQIKAERDVAYVALDQLARTERRLRDKEDALRVLISTMPVPMVDAFTARSEVF